MNEVPDKKFLVEKARQIRSELFEKMVALGFDGHPGSIMSIIEMTTALYYGGFIRPPSSGDINETDKLIISKGHASMTHYPILADLGYIPKEYWEDWGTKPSPLRVFANISIDGIAATTGSLGHGVGVGAGYALSFKKRGLDRRVFVMISEGELYEGSTWESLLFAAHHKLDNLIILLDRNNLIILGDSEECVALEPIEEKFKSFGFDTRHCDGHDFADLIPSVDYICSLKSSPSCLIFNTVKGKGFSIMENKPSWHYWNPMSEEDLALCRKEVSQ